MRHWPKLGLAVGAMVLAITAGTAAFAMRGGGDGADRGEDARQRDERVADGDGATDGGGSAIAASCLAGATDCEDMVGGPAGEDALSDCQEDTPCLDTPAICAPENGCDSVPAFACPDGLSTEELKECEARLATTAEVCVQLETDPPQQRCFDTGCGVIEPLPAPPPVEATAIAEPDVPAPAPAPIDDAVAEEGTVDAEPGVALLPVCEPIDKCEPSLGAPAGAEGETTPTCEPPPACDAPDAGVRCLPPDCAVSSDGAVSCPGEPPVPCDGVDGACSAPGDPGQTEPSAGGGSAPSSVVEPEPAQ